MVFSAAVQRAKAREDFKHSAKNRRRGPERELTHAEHEGGEEGRHSRRIRRRRRRRWRRMCARCRTLSLWTLHGARASALA